MNLYFFCVGWKSSCREAELQPRGKQEKLICAPCNLNLKVEISSIYISDFCIC